MVHLHFHAEFLPKQKKFRVQVKAPGYYKVELMTVAQFIRFAREDDKPLKIGGFTIVAQDEDGTPDDGSYLKPIRNYFKEVADSYMRWKGYFPNGGNSKQN